MFQQIFYYLLNGRILSVRERVCRESVKHLLTRHSLLRLSQVQRMPYWRYGELTMGKRSMGNQTKHYKDTTPPLIGVTSMEAGRSYATTGMSGEQFASIMLTERHAQYHTVEEWNRPHWLMVVISGPDYDDDGLIRKNPNSSIYIFIGTWKNLELSLTYKSPSELGKISIPDLILRFSFLK